MQYSAELENLDVLFTLGQISLVWHVLPFIKLDADFISSLFLFSSLQTPMSDPKLVYNSFSHLATQAGHKGAQMV